MVGVWDDHDYNLNNGDKHLDENIKETIKHIYLEFIDEPKESERYR